MPLDRRWLFDRGVRQNQAKGRAVKSVDEVFLQPSLLPLVGDGFHTGFYGLLVAQVV